MSKSFVKRRGSSISAYAVYNRRNAPRPAHASSELIEMPPRSSKRRKFVEDNQIHISQNIMEEVSENREDGSDNESEASSSSSAQVLTFERNFEVPCGNVTSEKYFKWLIDPCTKEDFFEDVWEQRPLHVRRDPSHHRDLLTCEDFDKMLRENMLDFTTHIDVVNYTKGKRETLNLEGRAFASSVWNFYQDGCSVRMRNPQAYHRGLWKLSAMLQEFFGSYVGMNLYLTPPGTQGFAPHYDDIDAFVLQLEGKKQWKLHPPKSDNDVLPRFSSGNFTQEELEMPTSEPLLKPGHLLYFPRGQIHQAMAVGNHHSLHITISTFQKNTWGDLLLTLLPSAVEIAMEKDVEFRKTVPKDFINYVGIANANDKTPEREMFLKKIESLSRKVLDHLPTDKAADDYAVDFIHGSMPPFLTKSEKRYSIHGGGNIWKSRKLYEFSGLTPETCIRLIRKQAVRMVSEKDGIKLYHSVANSKDHKEVERKFVQVDTDVGPAIELLYRSYPIFLPIKLLPMKDTDGKMTFAADMYENGLIMTGKPA